LDPAIRWVVGIDVAKQRHVACAIEAAADPVRPRPKTVEATAEGYAELCRWLAGWGPAEAVLVGVEATGCLWEPLHEALTRAGDRVVVLNPRQTAAWAEGLGLRAKTDGLDAQTLARGLRAGYARASVLPSETVQALRELTRARRDLVQTRTAARQRLLDELVVVFPELPVHTPGRCDLAAPALLELLRASHPRELTPRDLLELAAGGDVGARLADALGGADSAVVGMSLHSWAVARELRETLTPGGLF
jgi:transposase